MLFAWVFLKAQTVKRAGGICWAAFLGAALTTHLFILSVRADNVMNYGADGNDYFQFTKPGMAFDKASGFTTLIAFAMHVDADGTLEIGGGPVCSNGLYVGPENWASLVNNLKTPPTTVNRYEVCIGGWLDTSYDNIQSLVATQGIGPGSILYRNLQALKKAVPGIDAINDDDEKTYDLGSSVAFANLIGGLGYKYTFVPFTQQAFWVSLHNSITNCDEIYLQCYGGGAGNDPKLWNAAFGNGVSVIAGQESNYSSPATFRKWYLETGTPGGFYYPDIVFSSTFWSAAVIEASGTGPATPSGLDAVIEGKSVFLSWNSVSGAIAYNIKRSTHSGQETTIASLSNETGTWPASNQFADVAPTPYTTNYYVVSAVNSNSESVNSQEIKVSSPDLAAWFKADAITGLADGSPVALWQDSSGHGYSAIQTVLNQRPTFVLNALNGLPMVRFTSTNAQVLTLNRPVQDDFTLFCVFRSTTGLNAGNQFFQGAGLISATSYGTANGFGTGIFSNGEVCAGVSNPDISVSSIPGFNDGKPHLLTMRRKASNGQVDLYLDGNWVSRLTGNTESLNGIARMALGAQATFTNYFNGDIAEVEIFNGALSDSDRQFQETGLFQKWGVSGSTSGLLAYEGFDYPPDSIISGQLGGFGWSNGWVDVSGTASGSITSGSLSGGTKAPGGYDNLSIGNSLFIANGSRSGRMLDCSTNGTFARAGYLNASGNIGAPGKTLYISFLQQATSPDQFYEFELHRGNLGDPGRIAGIGNDLADAFTVNLRSPDFQETPFSFGNTNVDFYVLRIDYKGGLDDVYVYDNPTGPDEINNTPALTMPGVADMSFNGIAMGAYLNGVAVGNDEIRLGQTWSSVAGNPPRIIEQPASRVACMGQSVVFNVLAVSSEPLTYQWYFEGVPISGATNAALTLPDVTMAEAGLYAVTAANSLGRASSSGAMLQIQAIQLTLSNQPAAILEDGSNVVLNASITGAAPLNLQWYKNSVALDGANSSTLILGANGVFDSGQYYLVATNAYASVTSSIVNVSTSFGGLLAYEGFHYGQTASDISGAQGGFGWNGPWMNVSGGSSLSFSNNLDAGINSPAGFDTHSQPGYLLVNNASRKGRYLDCSFGGGFAQHGYLDANGNIGAPGTTLYISFLQQPGATSPFYEFEFKRGDLGDDARIAGIGNDVGSGNNDANLRIESPAGGNSTFYDLGLGNTNVNFYVVRIDYQNSNDTVTVYRNPTSQSQPAIPTLVVSNLTDMSFNGISLAAYLNGDTVANDEIRIGMSWFDVVGGTISELKLSQWTNETAAIQLAASPQYAYLLQKATNLAGYWEPIASIRASLLGLGQFFDTNAAQQKAFYRVANPVTWSPVPSSNLVIADFEGPTYGDWIASGTAFGSGPAQGTLPNQQAVSGYDGSGLANSYWGGDASTGTLTSPSFLISQPYVDFLIGGGNAPGAECMNLIVSNVIVATATGADSETLLPRQWNVKNWLGQTAILQIVDSASGSWGHILIDQIMLGQTEYPPLSKLMLLTNTFLNLPVKNGANMRRVTVSVNGSAVRDFNIELADGTPDWWAFVDVSAFSNQLADISVDALPPGSLGLSSILQINGIVGATNLYSESLRSQAHFSTRRGWINDANGMFFYNGQYHLYYQHDPFNWDGSGQKWWGHAASPDMVNWQELPEGIYSHSYGDEVYSGSAVVDSNNTGGFKTGTNDVIVAAFFSTARGECIAYSNDGGLTFTDYSGNPVVVHSVVGRDPHLFWYAPSNYWVMAVYDGGGGNGIEFYSTPDFHVWTFQSKIYNGMYECPDIFPLPVDGNSNNIMWEINDGSSGYMLGEFDGSVFTPATPELPGNLGSGFYASQTFSTMKPGDNRKVRIGWAQISTPGMPFNQLMYFPTSLTLQTTADGVRLCSTPVAEITNNAVNVYSWTNLNLASGFNPLSGIRGNLFDVQALFSVGSAQTITFNFQNVTVVYNVSTQQISCNGDTQSLPPIGGLVQLEIIVDRDTIEIFGNNGQIYMPLPALNATGNSLVSLVCTGGTATFNSLTVYKLKSIWPQSDP